MRSLRIAAFINHSKQSAGTTTAPSSSAIGQTSLRWPIDAIVRKNLLSLSFGTPLMISQLRSDVPEGRLQLAIAKLQGRGRVHDVSFAAIFLILFKFVVGHRYFVSLVGFDAPVVGIR